MQLYSRLFVCFTTGINERRSAFYEESSQVFKQFHTELIAGKPTIDLVSSVDLLLSHTKQASLIEEQERCLYLN